MTTKQILIDVIKSGSTKFPELQFPMIEIKTKNMDNASEIVGILMIAYQEAAQKFIDEHECTTCPAFVLHVRARKALEDIKVVIAKELVENGKK